MYFCRIMYGNKLDNGILEHRKRLLWRHLEKKGCMWSYVKNPKAIDDELLIEKALLYLEFEDLHILNWLLAAMFFDIKNPDRYLKRYGKPKLEARA